MLIAMICTALCLLLEACRTLAGVACGLTMTLGMVDAMYTHLLPIEIIVCAIALTGIWAGIAIPADIMLRGYRIVSGFAMALLLHDHVGAMRKMALQMAGLCGPGASLSSAPIRVVTADLAAGIVLMFAGAAMTIQILRNRQRHGGHKNIAAYEPSLMGLALLLMS